MPRTGSHNQYFFNKNGQKFTMTISDCEYSESRRFINSLSDSNIDQLFNSIYNNIWTSNTYGVQSKNYDTYLTGQDSTQDFITYTSVNSTFWGIFPFHLVCLSSVSFHPYNCGNCRWNILLEFGSASEFKYTNHDPNSTSNKTSNN